MKEGDTESTKKPVEYVDQIGIDLTFPKRNTIETVRSRESIT